MNRRRLTLRFTSRNPGLAFRTGVLLVLATFGILLSLNLLAFSKPQEVKAAASSTLTFQARLLNTNGSLVADGTYNVEFKIYDSSAAGASAQGVCSLDSSTDDCWWVETRTGGNKVTVKNGYLYANLGSVTAFGANIPWDQELWITMNIGGTGTPSWDGEMTPRFKVTAVPHALSAKQLQTTSGASTLKVYTATPTANVNYVFQDAAAGTYNICTSVGNCAGVGGIGDILNNGQNGTVRIGSNDANSVILESNGVDRLTVDSTGAATFSGSLTVTGLTTLNGGLTLQVGDTFTFNSDAFTDLTGDGLQIDTGSLEVDATVCRTSGNCVGVGGTGDILQGGNSFTAAMTIGTNDAFDLNLETSGTTRLTVQADGDLAVDTNTFFVDATNNRIGIGTTTTSQAGVLIDLAAPDTTSGSVLGVGGTLSSTTNNMFGIGVQPTITVGSNSDLDFVGVMSAPSTATPNLDTGTSGLFAFAGVPIYSGTATLRNLIGTTITLYNANTGTITYGRGIEVTNPLNPAGTITTNAGLWVGNQTAGATDYGIYVEGADTYALFVDAGVSRLDGLLRVGSGGTNGTATGDGDLYVQNDLEVDGEAILTTVSGVGLTDCDNATTSKLLWDSTTKVFSCGTDQTGGGGGVTTIGALNGGTANANGATITGSNLYLQSASTSFAGLVDTTTQSFAGNKTFTGTVTANSNLTVDTNTLIVDATSDQVKIGTAASTTAKLIVTNFSTSNTSNAFFNGSLFGGGSGDFNNVALYTIVSPGSSTSGHRISLDNTLLVDDSGGYLNNAGVEIYGSNTHISVNEDGNVITVPLIVAYRAQAEIQVDATVTDYIGYLDALINTGTITNRYGVDIQNPTGTGTITNNYGIRVQNQTEGTNDYGVYIQGADTYALWVDAGATQLDGTLTVEGNTTLNGNTTLGNATSDTVTFTGQVNSNILPSANDTYDLGSNSNRWRDLYLGGETLHIGASTGDEAAISYNNTTDSLIFKNATNSASAFQIQNSSSAPFLTADTANNKLEVVGNIYSRGLSWTSRTSATDDSWYGVTYGNGLFVAVSAGGGTVNRAMTSPDGINWTGRATPGGLGISWTAVTYGNGLFVAVANSGANQVMTSPDGITWTARTAAAANQWYGLTYGNGLFVAVSSNGTGNRVMTSPDGINWTSRTSAADNSWNSVTYGNGLFVAVAGSGTGNRVMTSPDGITWTSRTSAADNYWNSVTYGNGLFVAVGQTGTGNRVMTSPDGITWTLRTSTADLAWGSVTYGNGLFVAVAGNGTDRVMTSPDGITWTARTAAAANQWYGLTYGNGLFVATALSGTGNRVMTSGAIETTPFSANNIYQGGMTVRGDATFISGANSPTAFQIQNSSGASLVTVSTSNTSSNLITTNPSFEGSYNGWTLRSVGGSPSIGLTSAQAQFGTQSLQLITSTTSGNGVQFNFPFKPSTTYTISFWARRSTSTSSSWAAGRADNGTDSNCTVSPTFTLTTTWTNFTCTFTTGSTIGNASNFYIKQTDTTTDTIYIDGATLVTGSTALTYSTPTELLKVDPTGGGTVTLLGNSSAELGPWQQSPNKMTQKKDEGGRVVANGYIYHIGGYGTGGTVGSNVQYAKLNADGTTGVWTDTTSLPVNNSSPGAVAVNGYIYIIGGWDGASTFSDTVYVSKIQPDGSLGAWATNSQHLPAARADLGAAQANGYIYAIGGSNSGSTFSNVYYAKLNPDGSTGAWASTNSLPGNKQKHEVVTANGYVYAVGGEYGAGSVDDSVYYGSFNPTTGAITWNTASYLLPSPLRAPSVVISNGYLYVMGGENASGVSQKGVHYAKINSNGDISNFTTSSSLLPTTLSYAHAVVANGYVYLAGGWNGSISDDNDTVYYARLGGTLQVGGNLDLIGLQAQSLADGGDGTTGSSLGGSIFAGSGNFIGTLQVQGNAQFGQNVGINGMLAVQGGIAIGTADTTGSLLILDTKTDTGDPTGVNGGMYYNEFSDKFRCYQNGAWTDCIGAGGGSGVTTLAAIGASPNANGATISGSTLNLQPASASFGGVVTTGTQSFAGNKTFESGTLTVGNDTGGAVFVLDSSATGAAGVDFDGNNGTNYIQFDNNTDVFTWKAAGVNQLTVSSSGLSVLGSTTLGDATSDTITFTGRVNSSILPSANDTYDLGSDSNRWRDLYLGGETLHIGASTSDEATVSYNNTSDSLILKNATNAVDAFQLQNSSSVTLFSANTIDLRVNVSGDIEATGSIGNPVGGIGLIGNTLPQSEDLDDVTYWTATNITVTGDATTSPIGDTGAEQLTSTASGTHTLSADNNWAGGAGTYTFSIWIKTASGTQPITLRVDSVAGTPTTGTARSYTATTTWKRYTVTQTFTGSPTEINPVITMTNNSATIYAWGGMMIAAPSAGAYNSTSTGGMGTMLSTGAVIRGRFSLLGELYFGNSDSNGTTIMYDGGFQSNNSYAAYTNFFEFHGGGGGATKLTVDTTSSPVISSGTNMNINIAPDGTGKLTVGTANTTGTLFVLDSKSGSGEAAGITSPTNGSMYYNSTDNKFRCYEGGTWKDCIGAGGGTGDIVNGGQNGAVTIGTNDANALNLETSGTTRLSVSSAGNITTTDSAITLGGTSTANYRLFLDGTVNSSTTTAQYGLQNQVSFNPSGGSLSDLYGFINVPALSGSSLTVGNFYAGFNRLDTAAGYTGQITNGYGLRVAAPSLSGNPGVGVAKIVTYTGLYVDGTSNGGNTSGTISNYGLRVASHSASAGSGGTLNNYGIRVTLGTGSTTNTTNYGLYVDGNGGGSNNYALYSTSTAPSLLTGALTVNTQVTLGTTSQSGTVSIYDGSSNTVSLTASGVGTNYSLTLPTAAGATNQCLKTDTVTASQLIFGTCAAAGGDGGVTSVGGIDSQTPDSNGAVISGTLLYLQSASATNPGLVNTGSQTFAGDKTFTGALTVSNTLSVTGQLTIGTSDTTGTLLVLDTKTDAGDPTGTNGAMYYNSNMAKFRCYQNGSWGDCLSTIMRVTSDVSNSTTTFADVTGLTTSVKSGATYAFSCRLTYTSAVNTTAIQLSLNGPTFTELDYGVEVATSATARSQSAQTAYDTVVNPGSSGATTRLPAEVQGTIIPSADGTLALRFRSEIAASAVTVKRGSWCMVFKQ